MRMVLVLMVLPHVGMQCAVLNRYCSVSIDRVMNASMRAHKRYALDQAPLNQADTRQESKPAKSPCWTQSSWTVRFNVAFEMPKCGTKTKRLNRAVANKQTNCHSAQSLEPFFAEWVGEQKIEQSIVRSRYVYVSLFPNVQCAVRTHTLLH